ncbi:hypothetical protein [Aquimarina sp. 2201CG5-10]|uniref:hypothetical protein n=1 Tax=Aquimarina callyspongiae TaxID=3098150 RepID=UPI002AB3E1C1|nr:hypothetical protein [Aquimarina sp. 2201CG5-10]MDY8137072.1 hypothetical protein [Aquimarina sp. 2201CG5-10]
MKKTFFIFFVLIIHHIQSQDLPKIVPPAPNAASLAQYVEVPVSHYTGLPTINIPLYTLKSGSIEVPIGLSYHARGIKVEQIASNYGIGWSLNAGGAVTRQTRGRADDQSKGYLGQSHYDGFFDLDDDNTRKSAYQADLNGDFDRDPDLFMFNFLGFSGKFIYDRDTNQPILQTYDDIQVETVGDPASQIQGFIITDTNGTKYYFGKSKDGSSIARDSDHTVTNYTYTYNGLNSSAATPSNKFTSWYLMEIIDLLGRTINFTYESESPSLAYSTTYRKSQEVAELSGNGFVKTAYFSKTRIYQKKLSTIIFDLGEVNFDYSFVREDLNNSTALSNIEILNKQNQRIKKYVFDYFHTESEDGSTNMIYDLYQFEPKARKRLFLNSITEQGTNNELLTPFKFTYDPIVLPNRFSTSHDKWGYYNGKNNGEFAVFSENTDEIAGRSVDVLKMQAGLLKKIEYPTGGWSTYEYESNRAILPEKFKDIITFSANNNNPVQDKFVVLEKDLEFYDSQTKTYAIPFSVGSNLIISQFPSLGTLETSVFLPYSTCTNVENTDCPYLVRIYNTNGSVYGILHKGTTSITIEEGEYILKVIPTDPHNEDPLDFENGFGVSLKWKELIDDNSDQSEEEVVYTGGNRIKKITLNNGDEETITKEYEYNDISGKTSGRVFSLPSYYEFYTVTITGGQQIRALKAIVSKPANTLTYEQGNHGGYEFVTEYYGDKMNNRGKTEYKFTVDDNTGDFYKFPYFLPTDNEWLRGKPLEIKNFRNVGGNYELVSETKNTYEYGGFTGSNTHLLYPEYSSDGTLTLDNNNYNFIKLAAWNGIYDPNWNPANSHNLFTPYYLNMGTFKLKKTELINHDGSKEINNSTEYFYNYENHHQAKYIKKTLSNGKTNYTEIVYPQDKSNLSATEQKLKDLHQFIPLETNIYEGNITDNTGPNSSVSLSKQKTEFLEPFPNILLPINIQSSKGDQVLENRITYHKYDNKGNPLEVSKVDGTHIVYIWGYNKTSPIAQIENVTYNEVDQWLLDSYGKNIEDLQTLSDLDNDTASEDTLRVWLNNLREAVYSQKEGTLVTTYTYDPLIGLTSVTDPREETMYYTYDNFNRLEYIKDAQGNILSKNKYHYKN